MRSAIAYRVLAAALLAGCGEDASAPAPDAAADASADAALIDAAPPDSALPDAALADVSTADRAPCSPLWTIRRSIDGTGVMTDVTGGDLVIRSFQTNEGVGGVITQRGVTGDFEAVFSFKEFSPIGAGPYLSAQVARDGSNPLARQLAVTLGTHDSLGVTPPYLLIAPLVPVAITATEGSLEIARHGDTVTLRGVVGNQVLVRDEYFGPDPVQLSLAVGVSTFAHSGLSLAVRIPDFQIRGGGSADSDPFDCDRTSALP